MEYDDNEGIEQLEEATQRIYAFLRNFVRGGFFGWRLSYLAFSSCCREARFRNPSSKLGPGSSVRAAAGRSRR
jgi:hypothetical protein